MKVAFALALLAGTSLAIPHPQRGGRFRGGDGGGRPPFGNPNEVDQAPPDQPDNNVPPVDPAQDANNVPPENDPAAAPEENNNNAEENNNNVVDENLNNNNNDPAASEADPAANAENQNDPAATENGDNANANNNDANNAATGGTQGPVDTALLPPFGIEPGQNPRNNNIDCDGAVPGVPIPCTCPPSEDELAEAMNGFLAAGQTPDGTPVSFPTGASLQDELTRLQTSLFTLQNLSGTAGVGCPASSTTFLTQRADLEARIAAGES